MHCLLSQYYQSVSIRVVLTCTLVQSKSTKQTKVRPHQTIASSYATNFNKPLRFRSNVSNIGAWQQDSCTYKSPHNHQLSVNV